MPMPLHIFEDRYRQMLADVRAGNNLFALSYFDSSSSEKDMPSAGHVGCVAEVAETQALPDGRSNILAVGVIRYQAEAYVERGDSYLVVRPSYFEDDEEEDRKSTRLNSSHSQISYAVFCLKKKNLALSKDAIPNRRPHGAGAAGLRHASIGS